MKKITVKRLLSLFLSVLLLSLASVPAAAKAQTAPAGKAVLRVAVLSDLHYYPPSMAGGYGAGFKDGNQIGHPIEQTPGLLRSALAAIKARRNEVDFLLISGDLTRWGEYDGHVELAEILKKFEKESGIQVAVVPGNHDIDADAADFSGGKKEPARKTTPEDFLGIYAQLGYDLPGFERFPHKGEDRAGKLSYAVDLGKNYRLIAIDTSVRRIEPDLRAWVVGQCTAAKKAGRTVIGMGHHNLGESMKGSLIIMQSEGLANMREISEEFADAGMHFYFSGHMHMSEISPWYSDRGEVLYDIVTPGLFAFPGDFRMVKFTASGKRIEADIRSYAPDEVLPINANGVTYPQPYYPDALEFTFGYYGEGFTGFAKANARQALSNALRDLKNAGGVAAKVKESVDLGPINILFEYIDFKLDRREKDILAVFDKLLGDVFALQVSKLPCTRFIDELGFGDPDKPGTAEDVVNSAITYMFWKKHDIQDDPFMQDVLRRLENGQLLDQLLNFALPKILDVLGADVLPLLMDCRPVSWALAQALNGLGCPLLTMPLLALIATPGMRGTISKTFYDLASDIMTSSSPTGSGNGVLVYNGPVDAPAGSRTFRLPYDLNVSPSTDLRSAEIIWYTKAGVASPALKLTDKAGNAVPGVEIVLSSEAMDITVEEIDLAITKMMGYTLPAMKHTAKVKGLRPLKAYRFTAGDSEFGWWAEPQDFTEAWDNPVPAALQQVPAWFGGMLRLPGIAWANREYYRAYYSR